MTLSTTLWYSRKLEQLLFNALCLCHCCEAWSVVNDTEHHTLIQQEVGAGVVQCSLSVPLLSGLVRSQWLRAPHFDTAGSWSSCSMPFAATAELLFVKRKDAEKAGCRNWIEGAELMLSGGTCWVSIFNRVGGGGVRRRRRKRRKVAHGFWPSSLRRTLQQEVGGSKIIHRAESCVKRNPRCGLNKEVEPGSHSQLDRPLLRFRQLLSGLCLCDFVPHSFWRSKLRSTQVASHWRGPHLLNIAVLEVADGLFGLWGSCVHLLGRGYS